MTKKKEPVEKKCIVCGATILTHKANVRYCSDECYRQMRRSREKTYLAHHREKQAAGKVYKPESYSRCCHDCGAPTNDYRCDKCRTRFRVMHRVSPEALSEDEM